MHAIWLIFHCDGWDIVMSPMFIFGIMVKRVINFSFGDLNVVPWY